MIKEPSPIKKPFLFNEPFDVCFFFFSIPTGHHLPTISFLMITTRAQTHIYSRTLREYPPTVPVHQILDISSRISKIIKREKSTHTTQIAD